MAHIERDKDCLD